jgi:hypothetical protein
VNPPSGLGPVVGQLAGQLSTALQDIQLRAGRGPATTQQDAQLQVSLEALPAGAVDSDDAVSVAASDRTLGEAAPASNTPPQVEAKTERCDGPLDLSCTPQRRVVVSNTSPVTFEPRPPVAASSAASTSGAGHGRHRPSSGSEARPGPPGVGHGRHRRSASPPRVGGRSASPRRLYNIGRGARSSHSPGRGVGASRRRQSPPYRPAYESPPPFPGTSRAREARRSRGEERSKRRRN